MGYWMRSWKNSANAAVHANATSSSVAPSSTALHCTLGRTPNEAMLAIRLATLPSASPPPPTATRCSVASARAIQPRAVMHAATASAQAAITPAG